MTKHDPEGGRITKSLKDLQSVIRNLCVKGNDSNIDIHDFNCDDFVPKKITVKEHHFNQDIKILNEMYQCISNYESNEGNLKQTLITIGDLAGDISYNDQGDDESHYIRNRYGYIRRNKNKSINKSGIYFERLYHLKVIMSDYHGYLSIPEVEIERLKSDLSHLKQKITHILSKHKHIFHSDLNIDFSVSIGTIIDFSKKYYEQLILLRINNELVDIENIDYSKRSDRYYFARVFTILGELFNEFLEDRLQKQNTVYMTIFKKFNKLRNTIIHNHSKVKFEIENKTELINEKINEVINHLKEIIVKNENSEGQYEINIKYADIDKFHEDLVLLLTHFRRKATHLNHMKENNTEIHKQNNMKSNVPHIVEDTISALESLNIQGSDIKFPENQEGTRQLNSNNKKIKPDDSDFLNKNILKIFDENMFSKPIQFSYDSECRFMTKIKSMKEEIDYLCIFASNNEMDRLSKKFRYVYLQIMLVIFQLVRDIENLNICKQSMSENLYQIETKSLSRFLTIKRFSSSLLISESRIKSKQLRNMGLAHNIFGFDEENFFKIWNENTFLLDHFQTFYSIFIKDELPDIPSNMDFIGTCFARIGMYNEAFEYFEKAFDQLKDLPVGHDKEVLSEFDAELITVFGMNSFTLQKYSQSIETCLFGGNLEKVSDKCEFLWKRIDVTKINSITKQTLYIVCRINMYMFELLNLRGECTKAVNAIFDKLVLIDADLNVKLIFVNHYMNTQNYSSALNLIQSSTNLPLKYMEDFDLKTRQTECLLRLYEKSRKPEIEHCLVELESYLSKHFHYFKFCFGDKYLNSQIEIINLKLCLIWKSLNEDGKLEDEIDKIKDLSNQFKNTCECADTSIDKEVISQFFVYSINFHQDFTYAYGKHVSGTVNREILKEALFYLHFSEKIIGRDPKLFHLSKRVEDRAIGFLNNLSNFVLAKTLTHEERIAYLMEIFNLHERMNFNKVCVSIHLGNAHVSILREHLSSFSKIQDRKQYKDKALTLISNVIKYFSLVLECVEKENNFPNESVRINVHDIKITLAFYNFHASRFQSDLRSMNRCLSNCDDLLTLPLSEDCVKSILQIKNGCEMYLTAASQH